MITGNSEFVKDINKKLVMNCFYLNRGISRVEISRITRLNKSTVTNLVRELQGEGLLKPCGTGSSTPSGGRKTELLEFDTDAMYAVGVNFGRYSLSAVLMDVYGGIQDRVENNMEDVRGQEEMIRIAQGAVDELYARAGEKCSRIMGIGISVSGLVDCENGVVPFSPNLDWHDVPLQRIFEEKYHTTVQVDNCTRCIARGEMWFGNAKSFRTFLCVNLAYGVGSALVYNYKVISDTMNYTSELGHVTIYESGPVCGCGKRGCLETYVGGNAIAKTAQERIREGRESSLVAACGGDISSITAKMVAQEAAAGDPLSKKIIQDAARKLGMVLSYIVNIFDPEAVVLDGGVSRTEAGFLETTRLVMDKNTMNNRTHECKLLRGALGRDAEVIGAAILILENRGLTSSRDFLSLVNEASMLA